jgi:hypothetical protein
MGKGHLNAIPGIHIGPLLNHCDPDSHEPDAASHAAANSLLVTV